MQIVTIKDGEKMKIPANDVYVGDNKVINADGTLANGATVANGSITAAKLATDAVDTANIINAKVTAAKLATDAVETAKIKDKNVTLAKLADTAKTNILTYQVEDLDAGDDITNRVIFEVPAGLAIKVLTAKIIPQGNAEGIDDSNTCVIKLSDGANTLVEKTYDLDPAFPAASEAASLGTINTDYDDLTAGDKIYLSVTNGSTANPPAFMLIITYTVADAV
jgi:hypothetical protein